MKIYTKVRINISTGDILEEEFFEYSGMVVLCGGGPRDPECRRVECSDQTLENHGAFGAFGRTEAQGRSSQIRKASRYEQPEFRRTGNAC